MHIGNRSSIAERWTAFTVCANALFRDAAVWHKGDTALTIGGFVQTIQL